MALVNVQKKIRKSAAKLGLAPGEEIRGACTTNPTGSVTRMAIGAGVGGAVGAATCHGDHHGRSTTLDRWHGRRATPRARCSLP